MQGHSGTYKDSFGKKVLKFYKKEYQRAEEIPFAYLAWTDDGVIKTVFLFDDYQVGSLQIHCRSINGLTQGMLREIYWYVFEQSRCEILQARTPDSNEHTISILRGLGFERLCRIDNFYGRGKDAVLYSITKEQAKKWYK